MQVLLAHIEFCLLHLYIVYYLDKILLQKMSDNNLPD